MLQDHEMDIKINRLERSISSQEKAIKNIKAQLTDEKTELLELSNKLRSKKRIVSNPKKTKTYNISSDDDDDDLNDRAIG